MGNVINLFYNLFINIIVDNKNSRKIDNFLIFKYLFYIL